MTQQEIKKALVKAVQQFEDEYPEWSDYTLSLKPDTATVEIVSDADDNGEVKELLRDFLGALKDNNLMITEEKGSKIIVDEYVYVVEDGLDELADELEAKLGKQIANLKIQEKNGQPYVRFRYIGNITSDEKEKIKNQIIEITAQYQAVDEDDVFADVEFDDFDEVMDEIKNENMVEDLEEPEDDLEEIKAEDSSFAPGIYYHGNPEFKTLPRALQDLLRIDYKTNARIYEKVPYSDIVEGDWRHDRDERLAFIDQYKDSHVIVDIDTGEDYVILLALNPSYIESFEQNKAEDVDIDEESEETYFVIVDSDAPVEYTKEELLASISEEDFERLLAGEIIDYVNDDGEEFKVSLVLNNKAEDMITDLFAKDQIIETMKLPVNQKTDKMIWEAFQKLDTAIENQDKEYAEMLYNFVYAFDLADAALDMAQYEDLLEKQDSIRARIDAIEEYKAVDAMSVEVDYEDYDALADLYDEVYDKLRLESNNYAGAIGAESSILEQALTEIENYILQFTELEEDIPTTLAKLTPEQIEGYVQLINKWMNYNE